MAQKIQIRRGLSTQRVLITPDSGELCYDTDTGDLFIGDGTTLGGRLIAHIEPDTLYLNPTNNLSDLNDAATARTNLGLGSAATTASTDYATPAQGALAESALQNIVEDLTPQLGGDLNAGNFDVLDLALIAASATTGVQAGIDQSTGLHAQTHAVRSYHNTTTGALTVELSSQGIGNAPVWINYFTVNSGNILAGCDLDTQGNNIIALNSMALNSGSKLESAVDDSLYINITDAATDNIYLGNDNPAGNSANAVNLYTGTPDKSGGLNIFGNLDVFGGYFLYLQLGSAQIQTGVSINPATDGAPRLGSSIKRWREGYIKNFLELFSDGIVGTPSTNGAKLGAREEANGFAELVSVDEDGTIVESGGKVLERTIDHSSSPIGTWFDLYRYGGASGTGYKLPFDNALSEGSTVGFNIIVIGRSTSGSASMYFDLKGACKVSTTGVVTVLGTPVKTGLGTPEEPSADVQVLGGTNGELLIQTKIDSDPGNIRWKAVAQLNVNTY